MKDYKVTIENKEFGFYDERHFESVSDVRDFMDSTFGKDCKHVNFIKEYRTFCERTYFITVNDQHFMVVVTYEK